jgi:16S rRNA processing protein RimM
MASGLIETGEIVNVHGARGEVRVKPWANGPEALLKLERLYIDGKPLRVASARARGDVAVVAFDGVTDVAAASSLKGKTVWLDRADVNLADGEHFIADLVGLQAADAGDGRELGYVRDVMKLPMHDVYVIAGCDGRDILVPGRPEFVRKIDIDGGVIYFALIEGME